MSTTEPKPASHMTEERIAQQIRLWIYVCLFLLVMVETWRDRHSAIPFFIGAIALLLPWLEICSQCGRHVWRERGWLGSGPLWIGACKNCPPPDETSAR